MNEVAMKYFINSHFYFIIYQSTLCTNLSFSLDTSANIHLSRLLFVFEEIRLVLQNKSTKIIAIKFFRSIGGSNREMASRIRNDPGVPNGGGIAHVIVKDSGEDKVRQIVDVVSSQHRYSKVRSESDIGCIVAIRQAGGRSDTKSRCKGYRK